MDVQELLQKVKQKLQDSIALHKPSEQPTRYKGRSELLKLRTLVLDWYETAAGSRRDHQTDL